jgi:Putative F0F1-ATPase subunit Ca2+/Mg2+ transporter
VSLCAPGSLTEPEFPQPASGETEDAVPRVPSLGDFFWMGTACAISVIGAGAVGYGLDAWFHTTPWLTFAGLAFGIVSAILLSVAQVRKFT